MKTWMKLFASLALKGVVTTGLTAGWTERSAEVGNIAHAHASEVLAPCGCVVAGQTSESLAQAVEWKERMFLVTVAFFFGGERVKAGLFNLAANAVMEYVSIEFSSNGCAICQYCIKQHAFSHSRGRGQKYKQLGILKLAGSSVSAK